MNIQLLIDLANNSIYPLQAITALWGVYCVIVVYRRIGQKQFRSAGLHRQFLDDALAMLRERQFDAVQQLCDSPPFWSKAVPQLILVALANRTRDIGALRRLLAESFEREVISDLTFRMSWVNTVVKTAPMLGLLGTVLGMISAFGKIASAQKGGNDPSLLANDISFALITTAVGLIIAIPLVLVAANINVRMGKMQDQVSQDLGIFLEEFDAARGKTRPR